MKRNAFDTRETVGVESILDIHDFRQHDLEAYLLEDNLRVFAAEILFLKLSLTSFRPLDLPIKLEMLRDPTALADRRKPSYIREILSTAQKLFPDLEHSILASQVFKDKALHSKLHKRIEKALTYRKANLPVEVFLREELPEASIVNSALLYRKKLSPVDVSHELDKLEAGEENKYTGRTNWIHNNLIGSLLNLYSPFSRPCPFYAGFNTFCQLSHGNLRHFTELCYKSISRAFDKDGMLRLPVEPENQAEAARQASTDFLGEVRSFGPIGNQLHTFLLRLGSLFSLAHQRITQSEAEQSHFAVTKGVGAFKSEDFDFFREATKWSVLLEDPETKKKQKDQPHSIQYMLNPIYSPYFHITYRKKRKLELSTEEVICLIRGSLDEFTSIMKR